MLYGFETGNFHNSPDSGKSSRLRKEAERIHGKLEEFLPAQEARETAAQVYQVALDINEDIDRILKDPLVGRLYTYDGQFFTPRDAPGFHVAFDGFHILNSLEDCKIEGFFRGRKVSSAIWWLLDELSKHSWVAKRRRMNWEESGTLGLLPAAVLEEIFRDHERRRQAAEQPPPLGPEEQAFFQYFEDELARPDSHP